MASLEKGPRKERLRLSGAVIAISGCALIALLSLWLTARVASGSRPTRAELDRELELLRARLRYRIELISCVSARGPAELADCVKARSRVRKARDTPYPDLPRGRFPVRGSVLDGNPVTRLLAEHARKLEDSAKSDTEREIEEVRFRNLQVAELLPLERIEEAREEHPSHPCLQKPWPR